MQFWTRPGFDYYYFAMGPRTDEHRVATGPGELASGLGSRLGKPRKPEDEREWKAMQAGSELSGGLGIASVFVFVESIRIGN